MEEELPQLEPELQPRTDADEVIPLCRDNKVNSGSRKQAGSDMYFPSGENSGYCDRPVTESVTARTERNTDFPSGKDSEFFNEPVTEPALARAGNFQPTGHGVGVGTGQKWY